MRCCVNKKFNTSERVVGLWPLVARLRLNSYRQAESNISQKGLPTTNDWRPTTVVGQAVAADWRKPYNNEIPCLHIQTT